MKNSAFQDFNESAQETLDFARCQRPDGSFYGTSGQCRKGSPTGAKEKAAAKSKADKASKKEEANKARSQKQKQTAERTKAFKSELEKRKAEMKGASPEKVNALIAEASKAADKTEQLRQINTQEGRGGGAGRAPSPKAQTASELKDKRAEVREMDKVAKAADKKAEAADKAWRKAGMPKGDQQKEVRRLDGVAKSAEKEADKADKELKRMAASAKSSAGREKNVKLNNALNQDGPRPTASQRTAAMKVLRQERNRLESMEDEGKLSKAGAARLKLVKASQRAYEIDGKERMKAQTK